MATELKAVLNLDAQPFIAALQKLGGLTDAQAKKLSQSFEDIKVNVDTTAAEAGLAKLPTAAEDAGKKASSGFMESFKGGFAGGALGAIAGAIGTQIFSSLGDVISNVQGFETGVKSLSAVTGATGPLLDDLAQRARNLATQFGGNANDQLTVFQTTLSKIGPQLAESPEALGKFAENVNILGKTDAALGAAGAVDALTSSLLQFGVDVNDSNAVAQESSRFINVLAASAAVGSASVSDVAAAVGVVGATAKNANISFEETNAALQVLASKSLVGSQAGTALTSVLVKLQAQSKDGDDALKKLGTSSAELGNLLNTQGIGAAIGKLREAMAKLGTQAEKNALLNKLFGEGGQNAAAALLGGGEMLTQFTEGVTGTNAALDQAAINMDTFAERLSRIKAQVGDAFIGAFQAIAPIITQIMDDIVPRIAAALQGAFTALAPTLKIIGAIIGGVIVGAIQVFVAIIEKVAEGLQLIAPIIPLIAAGFAAWAIAINATSIAATLAAAKTAILNAVLAANPIGLVLVGVVALTAGIAALADAMSVTAAEQLEAAEATKENIKTQIQQNQESQKSVRNTQSMVEEFKKLAGQASRTKEEEKRLQEIQGELDKQYPSLIDQTKSFKENLNGVDQIGQRAAKELAGLSEAAVKLEKSMAATNRQIAGLQRNVAIEELQKSFSSLSWFGGDEGKFRKELQKRVDFFQDQLFKASTDDDVRKAQAALLDFLNLEGSNLGDDKQLEDIIGKVTNASNKSIAALKAWRGEVEKPVTPPETPENPTVAKEAKEAESALKAKQDQFKLTQQQLQAEQKRYENQLLQQALADGRSKLSDGEKELALKKQLETQRQIEAEYRKIFGIADGTDIVTKLNFRTVEGEDPKKILADLNTELLNLEGSRIKAEIDLAVSTGVDPASIAKNVKDSVAKLKEAFKGNSENFAEGLIDADTFETASKQLIEKLGANIQTLQDQIAITKDDKARFALEDQIDELQGLQLEFADKTRKTISKAGEDRIKAEIEINKRRAEILKEDESNRDRVRQLLLRNLELETRLKLNAIKSTGEAAKAETTIIEAEARKQRAAILKEWAALPTDMEKITLGILDTLRGAFSYDAEAEAAAEAERARLAKEEEDLKKSYAKREITIEDYQSRVREIREKSADENETFLTKTLAAMNKAAANTFNELAEAQRKAGLAAVDAFKSNGERIAQIGEEQAALAAELGAAALGKNAAKQVQINAKLKALDAERNSAITNSTESVKQAYTAMGLSIGASLGQAVVQGKDAFKALVFAALDAAEAMIPIWTVQIYGLFTSSTNPANVLSLGSVGFAAAAGISTVLAGLLALARAAVSGAFRTGGRVRGGQQLIQVNEEGEEYVANAGATRKFGAVLEAMNRGRGWEAEFLKMIPRDMLARELKLDKIGVGFMGGELAVIHPNIQTQVIVQSDPALLREMQRMQAEIADLKGNIRTVQAVEVVPHINDKALIDRVEARTLHRIRGF